MTQHNTQLATTILRIAVTACAIGTAYSGIEYGGPLFSFFWLELGWSESAAERLVLAGSIGSILAAVAIWFRRLARPAAGFLTLWLLAECAAYMYSRPPHTMLIPFARATRLCAPLAIALLCARGEPTRLLCIAAASTFAAHALEALWFEPAFVDFLVIASRDLLGSEFGIDTIHGLLIAIGVVDLVAAFAILTRGRARRSAAYYMVIWGLISAGARLVHSGLGAWEEFAIRLPNPGVPAAALVLFGTRPRSR